MVEREMTFGETLVGVDFNPGGNEKVTQLKKLFAEIIDLIHDSDGSRSTQWYLVQDQAFTAALAAQMMAVKSITFKY